MSLLVLKRCLIVTHESDVKKVCYYLLLQQ